MFPKFVSRSRNRLRTSKKGSDLKDKPLRQKPNSPLPGGRENKGKSRVAEAALDDVFIDDITFPAVDGYALGATLFLPRGAKRHAVLINRRPAQNLQGVRRLSGEARLRGPDL